MPASQSTTLLDIFRLHQKAIENIRSKYLEQLQSACAEQKQEIWNANFSLKYMIESQAKYKKILEGLSDDKQAKNLLIFSMKYNLIPSKVLQTYIEEVQKLMQSDEFNTELNKLIKHYNRQSIIYFAGIITTIVLGTVISAAMFALLNPLFIIPLVITAVIFACLMVNADELVIKNERYHFSTGSLKTKEEENSKITIADKYTYKISHSDTDTEIITHERKKTCSRDEWKNRFFALPEGQSTSLKDQVQVEFNTIRL